MKTLLELNPKPGNLIVGQIGEIIEVMTYDHDMMFHPVSLMSIWQYVH